ncbi:unnamed protein product [Bursaphelenchus xylophilus]|uniref:(pine wood nematode) hypothetical protein n=1 Tax=Bursaphelenchus xylophilus TaxID=6326 RepID=A0A811JXH4_BURXY|nr:unnamed protein product [Bursaphelenchus xylophilus]CAG9079659.1 unnamed protein product [Bursaphelenchus xylophilus]
MSASTFHVICPSSDKSFDDNLACDYKILLPKPLSFDDDYVCGLQSITFPYTWPSLGALENQFIRLYTHDNKVLKLIIPKGTYSDVETLIDALNQYIKTALPDYRGNFRKRRNVEEKSDAMAKSGALNAVATTDAASPMPQAPTAEKDAPPPPVEVNVPVVPDTPPPPPPPPSGFGRGIIEDDLIIKFNQSTKRVEVGINHESIQRISFSPQLGYTLGFDPRAVIMNGANAIYTPDLSGGISQLYVYAEGLTENIIVGRHLTPLLRIVTVKGKPGQMCEMIYDSPLFLNVPRRSVSMLHIQIRTMDGKLVPFEYGNVTCTLLFKRKIPF